MFDVSKRCQAFFSKIFSFQFVGRFIRPLLTKALKIFLKLCVKPGDLVLVMDESTKRGQWPKSLVQDVMSDSNGLVRRVRLRTADAQTLIRDIRKICLLEGSLV